MGDLIQSSDAYTTSWQSYYTSSFAERSYPISSLHLTVCDAAHF